jgi:hypothetical protein
MSPRIAVCFAILFFAAPLYAENPLTDRCSGHVLISPVFSFDNDADVAENGVPGGLWIRRDDAFWEQAPHVSDDWVGPWSPPLKIQASEDRFVRWYCFPGLYNTGLEACDTFGDCNDNYHRPSGFSPVGTAERSRCDFDPKYVSVRLGKNRKFQIQCHSEIPGDAAHPLKQGFGIAELIQLIQLPLR